MAENPDIEIIDMGIGDVSRPLAARASIVMAEKALSLAKSNEFTGYQGSEGTPEMKESVREYYSRLGVATLPSEIFVNDGAKSDCADIQTIFETGTTYGIQDPAYPVYANSLILSGKAGEKIGEAKYENIVYLQFSEDNDFLPEIPDEKIDVLYLCFPNNPTGATATNEQLQRYVDYANEHGSLLIYDAAYSWFVRDPDKPKSIYEVPGADKCAIEMQSLSKAAGFTGVRLGWTVIPENLRCEGVGVREINKIWRKRQQIHFNGPSNIAQAGGIEILSADGVLDVENATDYYLDNARLIKQSLAQIGIKSWGGENAPYVWARTPEKNGHRLTSWETFDHMLENAGVIVTPGVGFGPGGEGYIRFSAFGDRENNQIAMRAVNIAIRAIQTRF